MFTWQPGWTQPWLRFVVCLHYKRQVGIKREEFNKPLSYHPYKFLKKDPAKYTSLFNPGWTVHMHFSAVFNPDWNLNSAFRPGLTFQPGLSCKHAIAFMCVPGWISTGIETRHVNVAFQYITGWKDGECHHWAVWRRQLCRVSWDSYFTWSISTPTT